MSEAAVNEILGAAFLQFKIAEELLFHLLISDLNIEALDRHSPNIYQKRPPDGSVSVHGLLMVLD